MLWIGLSLSCGLKDTELDFSTKIIDMYMYMNKLDKMVSSWKIPSCHAPVVVWRQIHNPAKYTISIGRIEKH